MAVGVCIAISVYNPVHYRAELYEMFYVAGPILLISIIYFFIRNRKTDPQKLNAFYIIISALVYASFYSMVIWWEDGSMVIFAVFFYLFSIFIQPVYALCLIVNVFKPYNESIPSK